MRAVRFYKPVAPGAILVKHQIFSQDFYLEGVALLHLGDRRYRMPITAKQLPHRGSGSHSSQLLVLFLGQHGSLVLSLANSSRPIPSTSKDRK